jgi:hypothetical protein
MPTAFTGPIIMNAAVGRRHASYISPSCLEKLSDNEELRLPNLFQQYKAKRSPG